MLKKLRVAIAAIFFTALTLLFLDFTGALHAWLGWVTKIQFIPAVLAMNFGIVLLPEASNMLLFILPPGAFITLGFLIAIVNRFKKA